ncbi:hypothetical protein NFI96_010261, partial [Prochilodus magdalenae]
SGKRKHKSAHTSNKTTRREMEDSDAKDVSRLPPLRTESAEEHEPHFSRALPPIRRWCSVLTLVDLEDNTVPSKLSVEGEEGGSFDSEILTVSPRVIEVAAEEVVKDLKSSFDIRLPAGILYDSLPKTMMEELEIMSGIKITAHVLGGRLFPDEDNAISRIVKEACESLSDGRWMRGAACPDQWTIGYIADAILNAFYNYALECIQPRSSSPETDSVKDASLGLSECSISSSDSEQHFSISGGKAENPVPTNVSARSSLSDMDSYELEELIREFGRSADSDNSELRDDDWSEKPPAESAQENSSQKLISKFFRGLFCFGCCPSIRVTPL